VGLGLPGWGNPIPEVGPRHFMVPENLKGHGGGPPTPPPSHLPAPLLRCRCPCVVHHHVPLCAPGVPWSVHLQLQVGSSPRRM